MYHATLLHNWLGHLSDSIINIIQCSFAASPADFTSHTTFDFYDVRCCGKAQPSQNTLPTLQFVHLQQRPFLLELCFQSFDVLPNLLTRSHKWPVRLCTTKGESDFKVTYPEHHHPQPSSSAHKHCKVPPVFGPSAWDASASCAQKPQFSVTNHTSFSQTKISTELRGKNWSLDLMNTLMTSFKPLSLMPMSSIGSKSGTPSGNLLWTSCKIAMHSK